MPSASFHDLVLQLSPYYGQSEARSIAKIVFEDVFHIKSPHTRVLDAAEQMRLESISERLLRGEPLQYILGVADFFGLKLEVDPSVLIPRQETEELVAWALDFLKKRNTSIPSVLDLGTGSGCIALALKHRMPGARVCALDVSPDALDTARRNAQRLNLDLEFVCADMLKPESLPHRHFDLIVSNPPYIAPEESDRMPAHVLEHEPHMALFAGSGDPCVFYRAIARYAADRLLPGGMVLVEMNEFRAEAIAAAFRAAGFSDPQIRNDISGAPRMLGAHSDFSAKS